MSIDGIYRLTVAFILAPRQVGGQWVNKPIGTGFFVHMNERIGQNIFLGAHPYLVTAAHVIREDRDETLVRMNVRGKEQWEGKVGVEDIPVPKWHIHADPAKDVALAPVPVSTDDYIFHSVPAVPLEPPSLERIRLDLGRYAELGEQVFFMGLLGNVEEMGRDNIPMIRSGVLGAIWQDGIPRRMPDGTSLKTTGHLVDCYSYAGFSGSPCFLHRREMVREERRTTLGESVNGQWRKQTDLKFFGMIAGHFPYTERIRAEGGGYEYGEFEVPVNSGVAIVTPAEHISEVLMTEPLTKQRKAARQDLASDAPDQKVAED